MSQDREYISLTSGRKLLGTSVGTLKGYAARGLIGVQRLPGLPDRYSREDIVRLKQRCTRPATVEAEIEMDAGRELAAV